MGKTKLIPASAIQTRSDGYGGHGGYAVTAYDDECCPGVVDPLTLLAVLATIAGITVALRQVAIDTLGRKKRAIYDALDLPVWARTAMDSVLGRFPHESKRSLRLPINRRMQDFPDQNVCSGDWFLTDSRKTIKYSVLANGMKFNVNSPSLLSAYDPLTLSLSPAFAGWCRLRGKKRDSSNGTFFSLYIYSTPLFFLLAMFSCGSKREKEGKGNHDGSSLWLSSKAIHFDVRIVKVR